jgi:hypothetical protein
MHGKSFADNQTVVNTEVHPDNVKAFEAAGWEHGSKDGAPDASKHDGPIEAAKEKAEKATAKSAPKEKVISEAEAIAANDGEDVTKSKAIKVVKGKK